MKGVAGAAFVLLAASAIHANAAAADVTLSIENTHAAPGGTVSIAVDLANPNEPVRGLQFTLSPTPVAVSLNCSTTPCDGVHPTARSQGFTADASQRPDGSIRVVLFSLGGGTISPGSGAVLTLDLTVAATVSGSSMITLTPMDPLVGGTTGEPLTTTFPPVKIPLESPSSSGGGGGGGCSISTSPSTPQAAYWLIIWALTLAVIHKCVTRLISGRT